MIDKEPPGPKLRLGPLRFWRLRSRLNHYLEHWAREYGDCLVLRLGRRRIYVFRHPDQIRDILVTRDRSFIKAEGLQRARLVLGHGLLTSEGEHHLRQRRLIQPAFHRQRLTTYADDMVAIAAQTAGRWHDGARVDMHAEMMRLTLAIVGRALFDADLEDEASEIGSALQAFFSQFGRLMSPWAPFLLRLPLPSNRRLEAAVAALDRIVDDLIARRQSEGARNDLLSMLLLAQDIDGDGGRMSEAQVRDEVLTLLLAGHETTANALAWTWYLLAQHPLVQRRLQSELDAVMAGRLPGWADQQRLTYTRQVISESMRLFPPAWVIGREAVEAVQIGQYLVRAGSTVLVSQWVTHRDPRFFPDPTRFDPERWTDTAQAERPRFAYFPFGGGSRLCIGESFAWTEAILALATLAQKWTAEMLPGHEVATFTAITLRPRHGLPMVLRRRARPAEALPEAAPGLPAAVR